MVEQHLSEAATNEFAESGDDRLTPLADLSESRIWRIESAPDGMVMADEHGVILVVNSQLESMFGYHREERLGRKIEELLPDRFPVRSMPPTAPAIGSSRRSGSLAPASSSPGAVATGRSSLSRSVSARCRTNMAPPSSPPSATSPIASLSTRTPT